MLLAVAPIGSILSVMACSVEIDLAQRISLFSCFWDGWGSDSGICATGSKVLAAVYHQAGTEWSQDVAISASPQVREIRQRGESNSEPKSTIWPTTTMLARRRRIQTPTFHPCTIPRSKEITIVRQHCSSTMRMDSCNAQYISMIRSPVSYVESEQSS